MNWKRLSRHQIRKQIFIKLLNYRHGVSINQLSKDINHSRKVVSQELNKLLAYEKIKMFRVGLNKVFIRKQYDRRLKSTAN